MAVYDVVSRLMAGALGVVSPGAASRYLTERRNLAMQMGYAAASRTGPNGAWVAPDQNVNVLHARDRAVIQSRARALVRDNPNLAGALQKMVTNVIYTGIRPQARIKGLDGKLFTAANDAVETDFADWDTETGWYDLTCLALRHCWIDGGCLLHTYPRPDLLRRGLVPLGVELLPVDALDTRINGAQPSGNRAFRGVEVDACGNPAAYHVREDALGGEVPGLMDGISLLGSTVRLPVENCRLLMRRTHIGELLPVSWLHALITTMHDLDEYQNSERVAARLAAAFGVLVVTPEATPGNDLNGRPNPALAGGQDTLNRMMTGNEFIASGRIDVVPAGTDIKIMEHNRPGTTYEPFVKNTQRGASAAMGMSAPSFTNDFSDVSYSSARQAVLEERRMYRMQQAFLVRNLYAPLWRQWTHLRAAFLRGDDTVPVRWQRPGWSWVDPLKDANAAKIRVELGTVSRRRLCEEEGNDFDEIQLELAEESQRYGGNHAETE